MVWMLLAALVAGTAGLSPWWLVLPAGAALVKRKPGWAVAAAVLSASLFFRGQHQITSARSDIAIVREAPRVQTVTGWVSGYPSQRLGGARFTFDTAIAERPVRLLVNAVCYDIAVGDSLRLVGKIGAANRKWDDYLTSLGAAAFFTARRVDVLSRGRAGSLPRRYLARLHEGVRRVLTRGLGARAGIALALAIGDRGMIDRRTGAVLKRLGITHLLALSGLHLALVAALAMLVLRWMRIRTPAAVLAVLTFYVGVVGGVVSLLRAYSMSVILLAAVRVERPPKPMTALAGAALVLLAAAPRLFFSVGLQLSFAATLAILLCVRFLPRTARRGRGARIVVGAAGTAAASAAVVVFVAPLQIHYFGGVSIAGPLATVVCLPVVTVLLVSSWVAAALAACSAPFAGPAFDMLGAMMSWFDAFLTIVSHHVPSVLALPAPTPWLYYGGLLFAWMGRHRFAGLSLGAALIAASFLHA